MKISLATFSPKKKTTTMADCGLLEETKRKILAITNMKPFGITPIQLLREYKDIIGKPIPYSTLGFKRLEDFLKDIPDTVRVRMQRKKCIHIISILYFVNVLFVLFECRYKLVETP